MQVMVPSSALVAIYARENGVGMVFGHEPVLAAEAPEEKGPGLSSVDGEPEAGEREEEGASPQGETPPRKGRSEEHTSELQSRPHLVCRLLLEKKKKINATALYGNITVGFCEVDVTTELGKKPVYLTTFRHYRLAKKFHKPHITQALPVSRSDL